MGIHVQYDATPPTLIVWTMTGRWTITDLQRALQTNDRLLDSAEQRVDFIVDVSQGGLIPRPFIGFLRKVETQPHALEGMKVVVGADHYLRVFWEGIARYVPDYWQVCFVDSVEEARAYLAAQREPAQS
jgi:hypothetical protein